MLGTNAKEVGTLEMMQAHVFEIRNKSLGCCYMTGDVEGFIEESKPLVKQIAEYKSASQFLVSDNVSYLDFVFFELLELLDFVGKGVFFEENPTLKTYSDSFK